ncbi:MAG: preprotein translocase subunit SecG [Coriobacteriaceae bacterium]|nr:preprotein translocase subunit SecG [Coriobacteriaceae bacterium]
MSSVISFLQSTPILIAIIVIWAISAVGLVILILLHSGRGTGVSEVIAGSVYGTETGSSVVERNLDRITVVFAIVFGVCLLLMMIIYPHGGAS